MDKSLVCVYNLLKVERLVAVMSEGSIVVECAVQLGKLLGRRICGRAFLAVELNDFGTEYSARKIAAVRYECRPR